CWSGARLSTFVEQLDPVFGLLEPRMAEPGEVHAALVQGERGLERKVSRFELAHDAIELGDRGFEVLDGGIDGLVAHDLSVRPVTRHWSAPRSTSTRTASPSCTVSTSRMIRVRPASQHT